MSYTFFWKPQHKNGCFSQWYKSPFEEFNINFPTAEHYMMYRKALLFEDVDMAEQILAESSPKKVRALGRKIANFDEELWNEHKFNIVLQGNRLKFSQNPDLAKQLIETKGNLVEASPYDAIWGIGMAKTHAKKNIKKWGQNLLGKALDAVKREFSMYDV